MLGASTSIMTYKNTELLDFGLMELVAGCFSFLYPAPQFRFVNFHYCFLIFSVMLLCED